MSVIIECTDAVLEINGVAKIRPIPDFMHLDMLSWNADQAESVFIYESDLTAELTNDYLQRHYSL